MFKKLFGLIESIVGFLFVIVVIYFGYIIYTDRQSSTLPKNKVLEDTINLTPDSKTDSEEKKTHKPTIKTTVYQWKDENGVSQFSYSPPQGRSFEKKVVSTANAAENPVPMQGKVESNSEEENEKPGQVEQEKIKNVTNEQSKPSNVTQNNPGSPTNISPEVLQQLQSLQGQGLPGNMMGGQLPVEKSRENCKAAKKELRQLRTQSYRLNDSGQRSRDLKMARAKVERAC